MQFSIDPKRLQEIILEEVTKFYIEKTFLNEQNAEKITLDDAPIKPVLKKKI